MITFVCLRINNPITDSEGHQRAVDKTPWWLKYMNVDNYYDIYCGANRVHGV
jgi:hypothetical protein